MIRRVLARLSCAVHGHDYSCGMSRRCNGEHYCRRCTLDTRPTEARP